VGVLGPEKWRCEWGAEQRYFVPACYACALWRGIADGLLKRREKHRVI